MTSSDLVVVEDRSVIRLEDGTSIPLVSPDGGDIRHEDGVDRVYYLGEYICDLGRKKAMRDVWVHPEPGYQYGRCKMMLRTGFRCKLGVRETWTVCWKHGAGRPDKEGGLQPWHLERMRHFPNLPERIVARYQEFLEDPDIIDMRAEMALLDTRISELLDRLEDADTELAWAKVKIATRRLAGMLDADEIELEDLKRLHVALLSATQAQADDAGLWKDITRIIEQRRKLAETERRRIVESQQMLTVEEANQFLAYVIASIQRHVSSTDERLAIAKDMQRFTKS